MFSAIFISENSFCELLFSSLEGKTIPYGACFEWKEFSPREQILLRADPPPIKKGGKNENGGVASPEGVPIHLNL